MPPEIEKLTRIIEEKLDWGPGAQWQNRDFDRLNELILEQTGISLSASTLRRIWGKVAYSHLPSTTTLDALAKFAGYENWRVFVRRQQDQPVTEASAVTKTQIAQTQHQPIEPSTSSPAAGKPSGRSWKWMAIVAVSTLVIGVAVIAAFRSNKKQNTVSSANTYSFSSHTVTKGVPNSVIFNYDASQASTDSVFIQQSWDMRTRTLVDKHLHQHSSIYYEPGFYHAKLIVAGQVVKEHALLIGTNGWTGLLSNRPVPVYIDSAEFLKKNKIELPLQWVKEQNPALASQPSYIKYFNVGNFEPVSVSDFSFSAEMKNEYREGAGACQLSYVLLVTDAMPVVVPLSAKGCVSDLDFYAADHFVSGKTADLSGFGVDFSNWVKVSCKSSPHTLQYYVNDKPAYECPLPSKPVKIVGVSFAFQGTGEVKDVRLDNSKGRVFYSLQ